MYPPMQGLVLALGERLGNPWIGQWLITAILCSALCWMLQGWLPPFWALIGGLLVVVRLATFSYWVNSYFGGCLAAIGGALVLGALPRIKRHQRIGHSLLMGVGFLILANTRPYESLFFCFPVAVVLFVWLFGQRTQRLRVTLRQVVIPLGLLLLITAGGIAYYFWRVTGSPLRNPYTVSLEQYFVTPYFPWQPLRSIPAYHHEILQKSYTGWPLDLYHMNREHPIMSAIIKMDILWFFYLGPLFTLPVLLLAVILPRGFGFKDISRRSRFLLTVAGFTSLAAMLPIFCSPHYIAPLVCLIYALLLAALQRIRKWRWRGKPTGLAIVRAVPIVALVLLVLCVVAPALHIENSPAPWTWCSPWNQVVNRAVIQAHVENLPGRYLLLVRYGSQHDSRESWVFNRADIDHSKVVWANDMGPEQNQELIDYFKDRQVWLVEPDAMPARISTYLNDMPRQTSLPMKSEPPVPVLQERAHASH